MIQNIDLCHKLPQFKSQKEAKIYFHEMLKQHANRNIFDNSPIFDKLICLVNCYGEFADKFAKTDEIDHFTPVDISPNHDSSVLELWYYTVNGKADHISLKNCICDAVRCQKLGKPWSIEKYHNLHRLAAFRNALYDSGIKHIHLHKTDVDKFLDKYHLTWHDVKFAENPAGSSIYVLTDPIMQNNWIKFYKTELNHL